MIYIAAASDYSGIVIHAVFASLEEAMDYHIKDTIEEWEVGITEDTPARTWVYGSRRGQKAGWQEVKI